MTQAKIVPSIKASDPLSGPLPSWSQGSLLAPVGNNAFLSNPVLAGQAVGDQIDQLALGIQRAALYSGQIESHFKAMADQTKSMHEEAVKASKEVSKQHKDAARAVVAGYQASMVSDGPAKIRPTGVAEGSADDNRLGGMTFAQARTMGGNFGQLKQYGSQRADRWMSDWGARQAAEMPVQNAAGKFIDPATGRYLPQAESAEKAARIGSSLNRIGRATGVIDAVGAGEGMSGLVGLAGKAAGPIGMAIGAGQMINSQMISQRKTNAAYQNIYGGANTDAFGQRAQEFGFTHFGAAGTMGGEEAGQLFQGVSQLGLKDDKRQKMLDFAVNQYKKTGMDVSISLQLIEQATKNGTTSMAGLSASLEGVADAAKKSGVNIGEAQKAFVEMYKGISSTITTGKQAAPIAAGISAMDKALGKSLGGVSFGGMVMDPNFKYYAANRLHMDVSDVEVGIATGDKNILGKAVGAQLEMMGASLWLRSGYQEFAQKEASKIKAQRGSLTDSDYADIGIKLLKAKFYKSDQALNTLNQEGHLNLNPAQVAPFMAKWALGEITGEKTIGKATGPEGGFTKGESTSIGGFALRSGAFDNAKGEQDRDLAKELGLKQTWSTSGDSGEYSGLTDKSGSSATGKAYTDYLHSGGGAHRFKNVEKLLQADIGQDAKFKIKGKDGKFKDVTFEDAIKNYKDQLETGDVAITAGKDAGKTVGEVTNVYDKPGGAGDSPDTKVTVQAIGELDKFIKIHVQGGPGVAAARAAGVPASATADYSGGGMP